MKLKGISDKGLRRIAQSVQKSYTDLKPGDKVRHYRFGLGEVVSTNTTMYSIPMATVFCDDLGEEITRNADEFELYEDSTGGEGL